MYVAFAMCIIFVLILIIEKIQKKMNIINLEPSLLKHKTLKYKIRDISKITDITIHHSESGIKTDPSSFAEYHVNTKKWPAIGYHFCINSEGVIMQTNKLSTISYHNGINNSVAVGICLIGKYDSEEPSKNMLKSLYFLISYLKGECKNIKYLTAHKEYANTTDCCGQNLLSKMESFRKDNNLRIYPSASWNYKTKKTNNLFNKTFLNYNENESDN